MRNAIWLRKVTAHVMSVWPVVSGYGRTWLDFWLVPIGPFVPMQIPNEGHWLVQKLPDCATRCRAQSGPTSLTSPLGQALRCILQLNCRNSCGDFMPSHRRKPNLRWLMPRRELPTKWESKASIRSLQRIWGKQKKMIGMWKAKGRAVKVVRVRHHLSKTAFHNLTWGNVFRREASVHVVTKELEQGRTPFASATVVDSIERMIEIQAVSKAHSISKSIILVAKKKGGDAMSGEVENSKEVFLPLSSSLALIKAIVASSNGEIPQLEGVKPQAKKEGEEHKDTSVKAPVKPTTLRIVVDLQFIKDDKMKKLLAEQPHLALHRVLLTTECKEVRTHGWQVNGMVITGYCTSDPVNAEAMLKKSGIFGLFLSRFRQDVAELPAVTWVKPQEKETSTEYLDRVAGIAAKEGVALAWRSGGGTAIGYLKQDMEDKNHAWVVFGVPGYWGPRSLKEWLADKQWTLNSALKPPNGRYKSWAFQGYIAGEPAKTSFIYEVAIGEGTCHITVQRWKKARKQNDEEVHKIRGTKRWSADQQDPVEDLCTQPTQQLIWSGCNTNGGRWSE